MIRLFWFYMIKLSQVQKRLWLLSHQMGPHHWAACYCRGPGPTHGRDERRPEWRGCPHHKMDLGLHRDPLVQLDQAKRGLEQNAGMGWQKRSFDKSQHCLDQVCHVNWCPGGLRGTRCYVYFQKVKRTNLSTTLEIGCWIFCSSTQHCHFVNFLLLVVQKRSSDCFWGHFNFHFSFVSIKKLVV